MWILAAMGGVLFVAPFVFVGAGLPRVDAANFRPLFTGGIGGFAVASALLTFTVLGANAAVELGDEIVDPSRTIPRSFAVSIPVVTVIYVAIASILSRLLFLFFVIGGGFLAMVTTLNVTYLWGTKSLLQIAGVATRRASGSTDASPCTRCRPRRPPRQGNDTWRSTSGTSTSGHPRTGSARGAPSRRSPYRCPRRTSSC
jgi:hypothetical protein